jgi:hypothetical protein
MINARENDSLKQMKCVDFSKHLDRAKLSRVVPREGFLVFHTLRYSIVMSHKKPTRRTRCCFKL